MNSKNFLRLMRWKGLVGVLALFAMTFVFAGCDDFEPKDPIPPTPLPTLVVYGKVIDKLTKAGIGGATVSLKVSGAWVTTTTSTDTADNTGGNGFDTGVGDFAIGGLPTNLQNVPIVIRGPAGSSYIIAYGTIATPTTGATAGNYSFNLGSRELETGITATVYVVNEDTGQFVTRPNNAPLPIWPDYFAGFFGTVPGLGISWVTATQDSGDTNKYTINVPISGFTFLFLPAVDTTGDGIPDKTSAFVTILPFEKLQGAVTKIMDVNDLTGDTPLAAIETNFNTRPATISHKGKSGPLWVFFNQPVTVASTTDEPSQQITLAFTDDLKALAGGALPSETELTDGSGITVATTLNGVLLTVTPTADLTENEQYRLRGMLRGLPKVQNFGSDGTTQELDINFSIYIDYAGSDGIQATSPRIVADNFNGCTNGAVITAGFTTNCATNPGATGTLGGLPGNVRLIFPEAVWGEFEVVSYTDAAVSTTAVTVGGGTTQFTCLPASPETSAIGSGFEFFPNESTNGSNTTNTQGATYGQTGCAIDLTANSGLIQLSDDMSTAARSVTVYLDVFDSEGNTYRKEASYSIK